MAFRSFQTAGDETVAAAMDARPKGDSMDREQVQRVLTSLAAAGSRGDPRAFATQLRIAAPAVVQYLQSFTLEETPIDFTRTYVEDAFARFLHTLEFLPIPLSGRVLEVGANPYFFHVLLRKLFPGVDIQGMNFFEHDVYSDKVGSALQRTSSELMGESYSFDYLTFNLEAVHPYPYPPAHFDLILFCETLEHLVVNPLKVFREFRRILRPGGYLLITLPNALRLTNVSAMLAGRNFFDLYWVGNGVHGRHNREFSLAEIVTLLKGDGYGVVRAETRDRFDYDRMPIVATDYSGSSAALPFRKKEILKWIKKAGGTLADRGDNIYVVARRAVGKGTLQMGPSNAIGSSGEALSAAPDSERFVTFLDHFEETTELVRVVGWAFLTDDGSGSPAELDLILRDDRRGVSSRCTPMARSDVARAHGLEQDVVGFEAEIRRRDLPAGRFQLFLRIRGAEGAVAERPLGREICVAQGGSDAFPRP